MVGFGFGFFLQPLRCFKKKTPWRSVRIQRAGEVSHPLSVSPPARPRRTPGGSDRAAAGSQPWRGNSGAAKYPTVFRAVEHGTPSRLVLGELLPVMPRQERRGGVGEEHPSPGELRFHEHRHFDAEASLSPS